MDRSIIYTQEILRSYDYLSDDRRILKGLAYAVQDLLGTVNTMVGGLAGSQTNPKSLSINVAAGRVYEQAQADASGYGTLALDTTIITQQGVYAGGQVTFTTAALASGQSQYALLQATFSQADAIPADDPSSGVLNFYNAANPQVPLVGPGGNGQALNTVRQGVLVLSIVYGTPATTGAEVPPNPSGGNVPLYLVDLSFGQTQISNNQIITAGPNCAANVPNNYPAAPFIQGIAQLANPRTRLTGNLNFYVGPGGNDGNTGLGNTNGQAWQTLNHAWSTIVASYDLAGFTATINVIGNLTAGLVGTNLPIGGGNVIIDGGGHNITATNSSCFIAFNGAIFTLQNFGATRATGVGIGQGTIIGAANQGSITVAANMSIGIGDQFDFNAQFGGQIFINNNYTVTAGAHAIHWRYADCGQIYMNGITVTLSGTPSCTGSWARGDRNASFLAVATFSGTGTGATATNNQSASLETSGALNLPGNGVYTDVLNGTHH